MVFHLGFQFQRAVSSLQTMIESEIGKKSELEQKISSYDEETDILKSHLNLLCLPYKKIFMIAHGWKEEKECQLLIPALI